MACSDIILQSALLFLAALYVTPATLAQRSSSSPSTIVLTYDRSGNTASRCIFDVVSKWTNHTRIHYARAVLTKERLGLEQALSPKSLLITGVQGLEEYCYHWDKFQIKHRCPEDGCPCNAFTGVGVDCASIGSRKQCRTVLPDLEAVIVLIVRNPVDSIVENYAAFLQARLDSKPSDKQSVVQVADTLYRQGVSPSLLQKVGLSQLRNPAASLREHLMALPRKEGMLLEFLRSMRPLFSIARQYVDNLHDNNAKVIRMKYEDLVSSPSKSIAALLQQLNYTTPEGSPDEVVAAAERCMTGNYKVASYFGTQKSSKSSTKSVLSGRSRQLNFSSFLGDKEAASLASAVFQVPDAKKSVCQLSKLLGYKQERC